MRRFVLLLASLLILGTTGCARNVWVRPGASAADLESESSACFQEARSKPRAAPALYAANSAQAATNAFMSGFAEGLQEAKLHQKCMERRSWTLVPRDAGTPSPS